MEQIIGTPYFVSVSHVTENMTLDNNTVGETIDCNIIVDSSILVIDTGIQLTIEQGKTLIPDVYNLFE
jgi:hypothetical protein